MHCSTFLHKRRGDGWGSDEDVYGLTDTADVANMVMKGIEKEGELLGKR